MRNYVRTSDVICECDHFATMHAAGSGACMCKDSYGRSCECAQFLEDTWQDGKDDDTRY